MAAFVESRSWGQEAALGLGLFAGTTVLSLAAVTVVLVRLPATYFQDDSVLGALLILLGLLLSGTEGVTYVA